MICLLALILAAGIYPRGIKTSRHNLSSHGIGNIKSAETSMICVFCHTSHSPAGNVKGPLWNRETPSVVYTLYESSTLYSTIGQPDGSSKLCLSCHDGTISLGHLLNRSSRLTVSNTDSGKIPGNRSTNLGMNISDDHPVSFNSSTAVSTNPDLKHPEPGDPVRYDGSGKVQCTSCHDPHDEALPMFLVKTLQNGLLCKTCHQFSGFSGMSTHDLSAIHWTGTGRNPWPRTAFKTVSDNSCMNCHHTHSAEGAQRLLNSSRVSDVCLVCHDGSTGSNILNEIRKSFSHAVTAYNDLHDPVENMVTAPVHTQCVDCHNSHKVNSIRAAAPDISGRLSGVSGMSASGAFIQESLYEYEVCLKCHGLEKYNNPMVVRVDQNPDLRRALLPSNSSYHGVIAAGTASGVPSLRPGLNVSSRLYCTDCHNSNNSERNGGSGPDGPHGSIFNALLERNYLISSIMPYQESNYDLCWKCHRPAIIMNEDFTTFKYHKKHVDEQSTPCSVCHDPHGSQRNIGLINFDTGAVFPNLNGDLKFEVIGNKGYCYLQCHGDDHSPKEYEK